MCEIIAATVCLVGNDFCFVHVLFFTDEAAVCTCEMCFDVAPVFYAEILVGSTSFDDHAIVSVDVVYEAGVSTASDRTVLGVTRADT